MNVFSFVFEQIFHLVNIPFNSALPCWLEQYIFHYINICTTTLINIHYLYFSLYNHTAVRASAWGVKGKSAE